MTLDMTFEAREKIFRKEEYEEGLSQGYNELNHLYGWLVSNHREEEMIRAITDDELRARLLEECKASTM